MFGPLITDFKKIAIMIVSEFVWPNKKAYSMVKIIIKNFADGIFPVQLPYFFNMVKENEDICIFFIVGATSGS